MSINNFSNFLNSISSASLRVLDASISNSKYLALDLSKDNKANLGPPGQEVFFERIKNEVGDSVSEESIYWAVKMIFSQLVHFGVIFNTDVMKVRCNKDSPLSLNEIKTFIRHSVNAHLNYLKLNPKLI